MTTALSQDALCKKRAGPVHALILSAMLKMKSLSSHGMKRKLCISRSMDDLSTYGVWAMDVSPSM